MPLRLGAVEDGILLGVYEGKSLKEIGSEVGRSFSGVRKIMEKMDKDGYLTYDHGKARGRVLTPLGFDYLKENGLIQQDSPFRR